MESIAERQPQLQPALLRLSAGISRHFTLCLFTPEIAPHLTSAFPDVSTAFPCSFFGFDFYGHMECPLSSLEYEIGRPVAAAEGLDLKAVSFGDAEVIARPRAFDTGDRCASRDARWSAVTMQQ